MSTDQEKYADQVDEHLAHEQGRTPPNQGGQSGASAIDAIANYVPAAVHNFTGTPREVWKLTTLATGPKCGKLEDVNGKVIKVKHVYLQAIPDFVKQGGEVADMLRTVLIDVDGNAYATMSVVVAQEGYNMLKTLGYAPFDPPIDLEVVQSRTRKGTRMFSIVPV